MSEITVMVLCKDCGRYIHKDLLTSHKIVNHVDRTSIWKQLIDKYGLAGLMIKTLERFP